MIAIQGKYSITDLGGPYVNAQCSHEARNLPRIQALLHNVTSSYVPQLKQIVTQRHRVPRQSYVRAQKDDLCIVTGQHSPLASWRAFDYFHTVQIRTEETWAKTIIAAPHRKACCEFTLQYAPKIATCSCSPRCQTRLRTMTFKSTTDSSSIFEDGNLRPGIYEIQNLSSETYLDIHRHSMEVLSPRQRSRDGRGLVRLHLPLAFLTIRSGKSGALGLDIPYKW